MKILIIRFSSLGDCILLVPLVKYLKEQGAEDVTVVTKKAYAEIFEAAAGVDGVVAFDPETGLRGLIRIAAGFRGRGYRIIDAHNNLRSRLLCAFLGGAAGRFRKYYRERVGLILFKKRSVVPSILTSYGELAQAAGFPAATLLPGGIVVPEDQERQAKERLGAGDRRYVAVAPGSKWPMKRWNPEKYLELSRRLMEDHGYGIVLMGDGNDRALSSRIEAELGERCVNITGRTDIIEGAGYLKRCALFIGNDSGLMHLAEAVGLPVLVLFGPTVRAFGYYPALPGSKVIELDLDCRPCSRNGSRSWPQSTHECLDGIDVSTMVETAITLLNDKH